MRIGNQENANVTRSGKLIVLVSGMLLGMLSLTPWLWAQAPAANPGAAKPGAANAAAANPAGGAAPAATPTPAPAAPGGMAFLFPTFLVLIIIGCVAFLYTEGIWSNAIRLINVVTAALLATNFWEPVARWLEGFGESFTYYWDLLALWGLFAVFMLVFRSITSGLSKQKVKFLQIADDVGGGVLAAVVAWVVVCFITFTLHTAPLARNFMFGGFTPDSRMLMGLGPDRQWLGFTRNVSRGVYCRYGNEDNRYGSEQDPSNSAQKLCVFDREGWFISRYAARRSALEKNVAEKSSTRVEAGVLKR